MAGFRDAVPLGVEPKKLKTTTGIQQRTAPQLPGPIRQTGKPIPIAVIPVKTLCQALHELAAYERKEGTEKFVDKVISFFNAPYPAKVLPLTTTLLRVVGAHWIEI